MNDICLIKDLGPGPPVVSGAFIRFLAAFQQEPQIANLVHSARELPMKLDRISKRNRVRVDAQLRVWAKQAEKAVDRIADHDQTDCNKRNEEQGQEPFRAVLAAHPHLHYQPNEYRNNPIPKNRYKNAPDKFRRWRIAWLQHQRG